MDLVLNSKRTSDCSGPRYFGGCNSFGLARVILVRDGPRSWCLVYPLSSFLHALILFSSNRRRASSIFRSIASSFSYSFSWFSFLFCSIALFLSRVYFLFFSGSFALFLPNRFYFLWFSESISRDEGYFGSFRIFF